MRRMEEGCSASARRSSRPCTAAERSARPAGSARGGPAKTRARSPAMGDLGRAIRELRRERRMSIEALAFAASVHPTYLSAIERGLRNPSWMVLCALADALQIPVADLARRVESAARVREGVELVLEEERARVAGVSVGLVQDGAA
jgi:transcriptional regulator with XRE-family HTH domain